MSGKLLTALVALALDLVAAAPALAMTMVVNFSGSVSEIVAFDFSTGGTPALANEIGGSVSLGTEFSGSFHFDDALPASSSGSDFATYHVGNPFGSFGASLGEYAIVSDAVSGYDLGVHDGDYYGYGPSLSGVARALSGAGAGSLDILTVDLALHSDSPALLASTALDAVPWQLEAYSQGGRILWTFQRGSEYVAVSGTLDALSFAAVPEPALVRLATLAVLGIATLGFRRARSAASILRR
jgi:hypothetical protein